MDPTRAVRPKTNPIFAILEPTTLFIAISGDPEIAACKLTKSSGADVAKDTTVIPITMREILNLKDKATEDRTKYSPPTTRRINPKTTQKISIRNFYANINVK